MLAGAFLAAACDSTPPPPVVASPAPEKPASAFPGDVDAAARGAYGADGVVLGYGIFFNTGGSQALVGTRLAPAAAAASPGPGPAAASPQNGETSADVTHVSILVKEEGKWKEAFRADEHLKNRRGYLAGSPAAPTPAWHMVYEQTTDDGFRLTFSPLNPLPGSKQTVVHVAWDPKRREYDSQDASGKFLEPRSTPGGESVKIKP